ncbi:MAG: oxidoreductase [Caulobacterales bacterium]
MTKTYFITGASSGFGKALTEAVLARGDNVVATARRAEALAQVVKPFGSKGVAIALDVMDSDARKRAIDQTIQTFGRIDVLANIAGRGSLGAAEEFADDELREQMELNFFASVEMARLALPIMRQQGYGQILNLTSVGGQVSMGGFSAYAASKFALEGWSEALRDEVKPFGVRVTLVEPGAFRTEFAAGNILRPKMPIADYRGFIDPIGAHMDAHAGQEPGDPAKAAAAMIATVESNDPPLRLMLGADAYALWDMKRAEKEQELRAGRAAGEDTMLDGATTFAIGGAG